MKLVIIGGTGLIGSKLITRLREQGLGERSLIPADGARLGEIRFEEWLNPPVLVKSR
jgi:uncharacterized protein YbjT (DUF2867 family)